MPFGGGMTAMRREMLMHIRAEEDERWDNYEFHGGQVCAMFSLFDVEYPAL